MADTLGPFGPIRSPDVLTNLDILDLVHRIDSYLREIANCASATRNETSPHDSGRAMSMVERFVTRLESYAGDPELDLPKYHPENLRVPQPPELNRIENADLSQMLYLWAALRIEIAFSDSAERSTGFKDADIGRYMPMLEKMADFVQSIEDSPEIDLPDVDLQDPPAQSPN